MTLRTRMRVGSALLILTLALALSLAPEFSRINRVSAQTTTTYVNTAQTFCGTLLAFRNPALADITVGTITSQVMVPGVISMQTSTGTVTFLIPFGTITVGTEQFTIGSTLCVLIRFGSYGQVIKVEIAPVTPTPVVVGTGTSVVVVGTTTTTPGGIPLSATLYVAPRSTFHRTGHIINE